MRIHHAIFGEQNNGHALLGSSGDSAFAAKLTVLTDRPGDPPAGANWGPVVSGFALDDHYVFMRMQSDPTGRRAGMVRTYAAYVPLAKLRGLNNLSFLFSVLPSGLGPPPATIEPLDVSDLALSAKPEIEAASGRFALARLLCTPDSKLPLLWSSAEPYLPTIATLWAQLPPGLRANFSFQFLFAPEHYTTTVPTLAITLPDLASRWPASPVVSPEERAPATPAAAQSWLAGSDDGAQLERALHNYSIELPRFAALNLVSSFADMVGRLSELSFAEVRKAVNIAAKFSHITDVSKAYRTELFGRLCALTKSALADDLLMLRNLEDTLLPDLIPDLQLAMQDSIAARSAEGLLSDDFEVLKAAASEPAHWWSKPFVDWLRVAGTKMNAAGVRLLFESASSAALLDLIAPRLPATNQTESYILNNLPERLAQSPADNLAALAARRDWMRLHAGCLARSLSPAEAVARHVDQAGASETGLPVLESLLGFKVLAQSACKTGAPGLVSFVGGCIARDSVTYLPHLPTMCQHGRRVLQAAVGGITGSDPLTGDLRIRILTTLEEAAQIDASLTDLSAACVARDVSLLFELNQPDLFIEQLPDGARQITDQASEEWFCRELQAGRTIAIRNMASFQKWLGARPIVEWLGNAPAAGAIQVGINAFRYLPFLTDADFREWLVTLFTRTQYQHIDAGSASALADFLGSVDFPESARVVRDTALNFNRLDVAPIHESIRYKYQMAAAYQRDSKPTVSLRTVLIVTALPLERAEVIKHLPSTTYDHELFADYASWPANQPFFEVFVTTTGPGNLTVQGAIHRILKAGVKPQLAFFLGVCGGIKDSEIGDVVYSNKVYSYEGMKEEDDGLKARPMLKETSEALVQLAHRVAEKPWQPTQNGEAPHVPQAKPAVFASGEVLFASTGSTASNYQHLKKSYNDTQVVDQEAFGFLKAMQDDGIKLSMVVRGVSDKIIGKQQSDARGSQPLAAANAAAFLFKLLGDCRSILEPKKRKKKAS